MMELRLGFLRIIFAIEGKKKEISIKKEANRIENRNANLFVEKSSVDSISHIFLFPRR